MQDGKVSNNSAKVHPNIATDNTNMEWEENLSFETKQMTTTLEKIVNVERNIVLTRDVYKYLKLE